MQKHCFIPAVLPETNVLVTVFNGLIYKNKLCLFSLALKVNRKFKKKMGGL